MNFSNLPAGVTLRELDNASNEDRTPLQMEIEAATATINACPYHADDARAIYTLGALRGMLQGLTNQGEYVTHGPCFDEATTKALHQLLEAID